MTAWPGVVVEETNCPVGDGKEGRGKGEDNVGHKVANPQRPPGGWKGWGIHWGREHSRLSRVLTSPRDM